MQYETYNVTCAASVAASAAVEVAAVMDSSYTVVSCTIVIPDGHAGLTGIALAQGHTIVVPRNPGAFLSGNDEIETFDLTGYPTGAPWTVFVCNNDLQPHTWQTRWALAGAVAPAPAITPAPIPVDVLQAAA